MSNKQKNWIREKIDVYFLIIALAFSVSAYILLVDNARDYSAKINILVSPKNVKTAVSLDKITENILVIAQKKNLLDETVKLKTDPKNNLIEIYALDNSTIAAVNSAEMSTRALLTLASQYYDVKNDLIFQIVSRESEVKASNQGLILIGSIFAGLAFSFLVQLLLDLIEKIILFFVRRKRTYTKQNAQAKKDIDNFFKVNREKIQKLSMPFSPKDKVQRDVDYRRDEHQSPFVSKAESEAVDESQVRFKKASGPANLPIAEEDLNKIAQLEDGKISENYASMESRELPVQDELTTIYPTVETETNQEKDTLPADELRQAFNEPTEEEFKKRLNQLLGNK